jgi:hypothetical protein
MQQQQQQQQVVKFPTWVADSKRIGFDFGSFGGGVYYGPYSEKPKHYHGVCLREQVPANMDCAVHIPIDDFSVPELRAARVGVFKVLILLKRYGSCYVGCLGGRGRTGIILALLQKLEDESEGLTGVDAVLEVRTRTKNTHLVETQEQRYFVSKFPTQGMLPLLDRLV